MRVREITLAAGLLLASVGAASASVTFSLSNTTMSTSLGGPPNAGTLTGTFTTDDALDTIISFDFTASAAGSFAGFEYTLANSTVTASSLPTQYFQIDSTGSVNELRLYFASTLTASGTTIASAFSYEHEPSGGNRIPSGSIVPATTPPPTTTPEPATLALLGGALAGMGLLRKRRNG